MQKTKFKGLAWLLAAIVSLQWASLLFVNGGLRYAGFGNDIITTETIYFDEREEDEDFTMPFLPDYDCGVITTGCVPIAGAVLVGFYDMLYPDLVENYNTTYTYNGRIYCKPQNTNINAVIAELTTLMGTNVGGAGTTISGFQSGLTQYGALHGGYTIGYSSCMSAGSFDYTSYKSRIAQNKPVILFTEGYTYISEAGLTVRDDHETLVARNSEANHACAGFGWSEVEYYENGNMFRSDTYLWVSFGNGTIGKLLINDMTFIDDAYSLVIT